MAVVAATAAGVAACTPVRSRRYPLQSLQQQQPVPQLTAACTSDAPRRSCTLAARQSQQQQHPAAPPPALTRAREERCPMARVMHVTASYR